MKRTPHEDKKNRVIAVSLMAVFLGCNHHVELSHITLALEKRLVMYDHRQCPRKESNLQRYLIVKQVYKALRSFPFSSLTDTIKAISKCHFEGVFPTIIVVCIHGLTGDQTFVIHWLCGCQLYTVNIPCAYTNPTILYLCTTLHRGQHAQHRS